MTDAFLVSAVRTPIGRFQGGLSSVPAPALGARVVAEAVRRAGVSADGVDDVLMGSVLQAGLGQNPARQAALGAGLPPSVPATTVNMVCGSGLRCVMLAAQAIVAGDAQVVVAGGMESMSRAPYLAPDARAGARLGDVKLIDSMIHDGLLDATHGIHMGECAERTAARYGVSRAQMDLTAVASHQKAIAAMREGHFRGEILPIEVAGGRRVQEDEGPRADAAVEKLAALKPVFRPDGSVTPGNASSINDGAAALVVASGEAVRRHGLTPLARISAWAQGGVEPEWLLMAPVAAVRALERKSSLRLGGMDLIEINEAFAAQVCALTRELEIDPSRLNVNGGAIALGHPLGASGARVLVTLLFALRRRGLRRGLATLCLGGGNAVAVAIETA